VDHLEPQRAQARLLVGRTAELTQLDDAATRAASGFRLVEVVGEPGTGKSRLLAEFVANRSVLKGRAAESEREVPFAPLVDALVDRVDAALADRLSEPEAQLLATVFPVLSKKPATDIVKPRLYRAMRSLLRAVAVAPTTIVLDDMHWADESTIELLDYLVRHPLPAPVLLVVAYRPHQVSFRLSKALADHSIRIDLAPLSAADADQLLGPTLSPHTRQRLYEASGGNPFYLATLARSRRTEDDLLELPEWARATVAAELAGLADQEALIARSAAVAGDTFGPALIAHVAEVPEQVVLQAFDDLVARDILRETAGRFQFRHSVVRHVAYNSAAAGWRHGAHARIAAYLAKVGAPATRRAEHVLRSAKYGDQEAADTLVAAARAVARRQPAKAAVWYEAARQLSVDDDVKVRAELAVCQGVSGRIMPALETFGTVLRALDDHAERAMAAAFAALLAHLRGEHEWARLLLTSELNRQPDPESESAAPLRLQLVLDAALRGDAAKAKPFLDAAPDDDRNRWTVPFAAMQAYVKTVEGNRFEAAPAVLAAARMVDASDDDELLGWLPVIHMLGWAEVLVGEHRQALRHFTKAVDLARDNGHLYFMPQLLHGLAFAYVVAGRIGDGLAAVEEALESLDPQSGIRGALHGVWCQLNSWRGQHAAAIRAGRRAIAKIGDDHPSLASLARNQLLLAQVHAGNHAAAVDEIRPALPAIDPYPRLISFTLLAKADALAGNHEQARQWARNAQQLADERLDVDLVFSDLAWAYADNDADRALTAAAAAERIGMPLWEATARLLAGTCLARDGHRDQALRELQAAATIFNLCEATELHATAVREQRRLGVRVPHTGALANTLSPRELDVAELVCAGSTNQQIAEKLVLSVRTVETHLTHIFAKLGVTNRAGVARVLASQSED
jgi:DNA-binding CsgD family transcriptional regulator/tetratricopeptide (TPR) repeat protein